MYDTPTPTLALLVAAAGPRVWMCAQEAEEKFADAREAFISGGQTRQVCWMGVPACVRACVDTCLCVRCVLCMSVCCVPTPRVCLCYVYVCVLCFPACAEDAGMMGSWDIWCTPCLCGVCTAPPLSTSCTRLRRRPTPASPTSPTSGT